MPLFSKDTLTLPKEDELEISIFGPGYGESIVLHIPQVGWGIIDSCVQKFGNTTIIPTLEYLLNIIKPSFPKLAFVILTHPYQAHCEGLDKIIKEYPGGVDRVCRHDGYGIRELRAYNADSNTIA